MIQRSKNTSWCYRKQKLEHRKKILSWTKDARTTQTSNFSSATKIIIKISRKLKKKFFDTEKKKFKLNSIQTQLLYCTTWHYYNVNFSRKSAIKRFIKEKLWWDTLIFQPCCSETFCKVKAKLANQKCFPGNSNSLCWVSYEES